MSKHNHKGDLEDIIACRFGDPDFPNPSKLTPQEYEHLKAMWDTCMPKLNSEDHVGKYVWVFGTGGDINKSNPFRKMWEDKL